MMTSTQNSKGKRSSIHRTILAIAALGFGGLFSGTVFVGCGSIVSDRCDQICSCENCGPRQRTECEIKANADIDIADAYGCSAILQPFWDCEVQKHECSADHHYSDDLKECAHEYQQYQECLDKSSSRNDPPGPYSGPSQ